MNIVAIGGGERTPHVKKALELTGDAQPTALIIPTAASTLTSYEKKVALYKATFDELGIESDTLHQFEQTPSSDEIANKIGSASLLYTFGGNSPYMIRKMEEHGTNKAIFDAIQAGKVHAGLSAGALLPFRLALSNPASKPSEVDWDFSFIRPGVNAIDAVATTHANIHDPIIGGVREESRYHALMNSFPAEINHGYAISNNASAIFGDAREVFTAQPDAYVKYIYRDADGSVKSRDAQPDDLVL